jgi:hypothetical protein
VLYVIFKIDYSIGRLSDARQLNLAKLERIKQGGFWRFVLLRGVLAWGLPMGVVFIIFEHVSRKEEAFAWYFILTLCLAGGFVCGVATWCVFLWICSRAPKAG